MTDSDTYDDNGWWVGAVTPLPQASAFSLLAPDVSSLLNAERVKHQAKKFFALDVTSARPKHYPGGGFPRSDRFSFDVGNGDRTRRVEAITLPLESAPDVARQARVVGDRVGAGMDVLVRRAKRLWQVPGDEDDPYALALVAVLASLLLGPVLPPSAGTVFGVKTARQRLDALSWGG